MFYGLGQCALCKSHMLGQCAMCMFYRLGQCASATRLHLNMLDMIPCKEDAAPVAKFMDPDYGNKVNSGIGLSYRPPDYMGWRAGTTTQCRS